MLVCEVTGLVLDSHKELRKREDRKDKVILQRNKTDMNDDRSNQK